MPGKTTPTLSGPTGAVHDDMDVIAVGASWVVNGAGFSATAVADASAKPAKAPKAGKAEPAKK